MRHPWSVRYSFPPRPRTWIARALVGALVLFGFLPVAHGLSVETLRLEPLQPMPGEDFMIFIEGEATPGVGVDEISLEGTALDVVLNKSLSCGPCEDEVPFALEIPVSGDVTAGAAEGLYQLSIWPGEDGQYLGLFLIERYFGLGARVTVPLDLWISTDFARRWTENDRVLLSVPYQDNLCYFPILNGVSRVEEKGDRILVFVDTWDFLFDLGLRPPPPEAAEKCQVSAPFLTSLNIDLGSHVAGDYSVELFLEQKNGDLDSLPIRVAQQGLRVHEGSRTVALRDGRFEVRVEWDDGQGATGEASPVANPTRESALFTFFGRDNWELMIKVLDGCGFNGHFWVFTAGATNVEYTVYVTDTRSGETWSSTNPQGMTAETVTDTAAFATCDI